MQGLSRARIAGPDAFREAFGVSRETTEKLECYEVELRRWQKAVNLVAPKTMDEIWHRHFADSAQLRELIPSNAEHLVDVGSGGGFPGLVLATMLAEGRDIRVTLVESDTRKAAFLRETARRMEIPVEILSTRIESNASVQTLIDVDILVARAFAPLRRLLSLVFPVFSYRTVGVFLKGRDIAHEIDDAREDWTFEVELHESVTDQEGRMAVIRRLARKPEV